MDYYKLAEDLMDYRLSSLALQTDRQLAKLETGELFVLNYLFGHDRRAYPKDLSKAMVVSTARIAMILKKLERDQLIVRTADTGDSRQVIVSLTPLGMELIQRKRRELLSLWAEMLEALGPEDAKEYIRLKKKLLKYRR